MQFFSFLSWPLSPKRVLRARVVSRILHRDPELSSWLSGASLAEKK